MLLSLAGEADAPVEATAGGTAESVASKLKAENLEVDVSHDITFVPVSPQMPVTLV